MEGPVSKGGGMEWFLFSLPGLAGCRTLTPGKAAPRAELPGRIGMDGETPGEREPLRTAQLTSLPCH